MLDDMEMKFNQIRDALEESVYTTKKFTIHVFQALFTTTNKDFWCYVKGKKDPFMKVKMDAAIISLTSKLNNLENKLKITNGGNSSSQGNSNSGRKQGKGKENNSSKEGSDKGKNKGLPE
eukprot:14851776-Ditylum_brightwellii.AAC.1